MGYNITIVQTTPFHGQRPGTSGLRKPVKTFVQKSYTENFVQCILDALTEDEKDGVLVVGGDGRYYCKTATDIILKMCAANGVSKVIVGKSGILSTPAASALIRKHRATGGIILTASHNPGGIDNDFGIKFNLANGGPAPDYMTNKVYLFSTEIKTYKIVTDLNCDIEVLGVSEYDVDGVNFTVEVIDPVENYVNLMKSIFDFPSLKTLFEGETPSLKILIDSMNGVTGPYVERIFLKELQAPVGSVVNTVPLEDFGGKHPDPNLTYAAELVQALQNGDLDFGAAYDGDGDRNMILG